MKNYVYGTWENHIFITVCRLKLNKIKIYIYNNDNYWIQYGDNNCCDVVFQLNLILCTYN